MDIKEQAKQNYLAGMKIKDIANKIGKSASTIRSWKSRYKWDGVSITYNALPETFTIKRNIKTLRRLVRHKKGLRS